MIGKFIGLVVLIPCLVSGKTARRDSVDQQIDRIKTTQSDYNVRLDSTQAFHDWLVDTSREEMPMRLERFYGKLTKGNMQRRLYAFYKWSVGRSEASRSDYAKWLSELADWFQESATETAAEKAKKNEQAAK